jgi:thiol-disulfide isomerase/thioredoxin
MIYLRSLILVSLIALLGFNSAAAVKPFVKGSFSEIQQQYTSKPYLIVFWGQDCAYCMKELAMLGELLETFPDVSIVTVATDPFLDSTFVMDKMSGFGLVQAENWVFADDYPETLYFDVEKRWRGELPLTYLSDGGQLIRHSGMLKKADMSTWLANLGSQN